MPFATTNTPAAAASQAGSPAGIFQAIKPGTAQTVSVSNTSAATSNEIGTTLFRVYCTVKAHLVVGSSPTATTNSTPIAAESAEYFVCSPSDKVALIKQSGESDGTAYVTPAATVL